MLCLHLSQTESTNILQQKSNLFWVDMGIVFRITNERITKWIVQRNKKNIGFFKQTILNCSNELENNAYFFTKKTNFPKDFLKTLVFK